MEVTTQRSCFEAAKAFFATVAREEAAARFLADAIRTVSFQVTGGESFTVRVQRGDVRVDKGATPTADLRVEVDAETCLKLFAGRVSPAEAFHQRKLWFDGIPYIGYPWLTRLIKIGQTGR